MIIHVSSLSVETIFYCFYISVMHNLHVVPYKIVQEIHHMILHKLNILWKIISPLPPPK